MVAAVSIQENTVLHKIPRHNEGGQYRGVPAHPSTSTLASHCMQEGA